MSRDRVRPRPAAALWAGERGASLVETALVVMLLMFMVAGIVDVGRAFAGYIVVVNASREGARYASRYPFHQAGIVAAVETETTDNGLPAAAVSVGVAGLNGDAGQPIGVTVNYQMATVLGQIIGLPSINLSSTTRMVIFGIGPMMRSRGDALF